MSCMMSPQFAERFAEQRLRLNRLLTLRENERGREIATPCCNEWPLAQIGNVERIIPYREEATLPERIRTRFECPECEREWFAQYRLTSHSPTERIAVSESLGMGDCHQWWLPQGDDAEHQQPDVITYAFVQFEPMSSLPERQVREEKRRKQEARLGFD